jgi:glycerol-3-phosphate acyltransferase PlsY
MAFAIVLPLFGYLLGSLSLSRLAVRIKGLALPGSTGAQNVARLAGTGWGIASGVFDFAKGLVPVLVGRMLGINEWAVALAGAAAVAGHIWPLYYGFHGGRGLNTITGATVLLLPREIPVAWGLGIGVGYAVHSSAAVRGYVDPLAAGAAGGLIGLIVLAVLFREEAPLVAYAVGVAILPMISGFSDMVAFFARLAKGG